MYASDYIVSAFDLLFYDLNLDSHCPLHLNNLCFVIITAEVHIERAIPLSRSLQFKGISLGDS